jgi:hypothetical protein
MQIMGGETAVGTHDRHVRALAVVAVSLTLIAVGCDDGYARFVARVTDVQTGKVCLDDQDKLPGDPAKCYKASPSDLPVLVKGACVKLAAPDSPDDYLTKPLKEVKPASSCK